MKITATARPFILEFTASGNIYPITSEEAQNLLDAYPAVHVSSNVVVLQGHNTADAMQRCILRPATHGGGPAFVITIEVKES
jgi:hypothetical protein